MLGLGGSQQDVTGGFCGGNVESSGLSSVMRKCKYDGESIIICNAFAFVFLLAALSFSHASVDVVFFLSQLCRFEVARSVPLSQP